MISFTNLEKRFSGTTILDGVSGTVERGKAVALVGPSGSGKSTLLRCLNFLSPPCAGRIRFEDQIITPNAQDLSILRRKVGMVFQHFNLFPHMTIAENITLAPIRVLGRKPQEALEKAQSLLQQVGLAHVIDRYPHNLSGGQKQRVAIARALAMGPEVMLFDEPTSALDPEMVHEVTAVISDLHHHKMTMLIVTHAMRVAENIADEVWFLDQGRILEKTPSTTFFQNPQTERARNFLKQIS